ncbi:MAG: collagen binding domain-containing protein [Parvularculaceae bacterium]
MNGSILGAVVDADTLYAVSGVLVCLQPHSVHNTSADDHEDWRQVTGEAGAFVFSNVPAGHWLVSCRSHSGEKFTQDLYLCNNAAAVIQFECGPETAIGKRQMSEDLGSVTGVVCRGELDEPVADASVIVVKGPASAPDIASITDSDGAFSFGGLIPGKWAFEAIGPDGDRARATVVIGPAQNAQMKIKIKKKS